LGERRKIRTLFRAGQGFLQPQNDGVEKAEFAGHPRQAIDENQPAHKKQQSSAEYFDGVQMLSEALIKTQELSDAERGEEKRHGEAGGIHRKQQNAARDGIAGGGERQHRGKNRSDTRRPVERERGAEQEPAPDAGALA